MTAVCQNSPASLSLAPLLKAFKQFQKKSIDQIKARLDQLTKHSKKIDNNLYCRFCKHRITSLENTLEINGSVTHRFTNPSGNTYDITCFTMAQGCTQYGPSTMEHTWFSGYSWRHALCSGCYVHLGWFYQSSHDNFYGLIGNMLSGSS